jgi:APA family basic amino acid/polyamine antiporter
LFSATALVVANMVGAGVFTTSGFSLADLGSRSWVMAAWFVGGLIALCGAVSYGALVRHMAVSGGEYLFLSRVIHPAAGFLAGWVSLLAGFTGAIAFAATVFETYLVPASVRPAWLPEGLVGIGVIVFCGLAHGIVVRYGVRAQNAIVVLKLLFIAGFVGFATVRLGGAGWPGLEIAGPTAAFSVTAFAMSLVWISLSYSGFNAAVYIASEIEDAPRTAPRALWLGTSTVAVGYLVLNAVFVYAPLPADVAGRPDVAAAAAATLGGEALSTALRVVISLALLSSVSSMIVIGPRVYAQMARDRVFPPFFNFPDDGEGSRAPVASIVLQVVLASLLVLFSGLSSLLSYLGLVLSMSAAGAVACLFVLRRREGASVVRGIGYPLVPAIFVLSTVTLGILSAAQRPKEWIAAVATLLSGLVAYRLFRRS